MFNENKKQINGDNPGNILNRILYFYQSLINQKKGSNDYIKIDNPTISILNVETFNKSPSRLLCDGFWNSINYENLKLQLKSNLNFFDIGCGSGQYGIFLKKFANRFFESYTGLDVYKDDNYPSEFNHINDKAENSFQHINKKINFIISQSALEHIEKDVFAIKEITKKLSENNTPFIQIHMLPASKGLWMHLWHGYRQYSKKNLSSISSLLKKNYDVSISIVPLGGSNSFWTHLRYITFPTYFRSIIHKHKLFKWSNQKNVEEKIINSVSKELNCTEEHPIFWGLIITSKNINLKYKY